MNYNDTLQSVKLVLAAQAVPLLIGETGIGKTALATDLAAEKGWTLIDIDGNILKEGEIGGLPTVENRTTVYAIHHKLREIDEALAAGKTVLLFIDEINRCEHAVQQELMNLILNHEINGYHLDESVRIIAAMNPTDTYLRLSDRRNG
jgi:MoxR-like ATPase